MTSTPATGPEQTWLAFLAEGRLMLQRARGSGRHVFYPRVAEPGSGDTDLDWVPASGRGIVHAVTVVRRRPPELPYNVVLVDLEEGVRMMGRVEGVEVDAVRIGMPVQARIAREGDTALVVFEVVAA